MTGGARPGGRPADPWRAAPAAVAAGLSGPRRLERTDAL